MSAIILGWNPQRWPWEDYDEWVNEVRLNGPTASTWTVGRRINITAGTDAWLLLQGERRGLVGRAIVQSPKPYEVPHFADETRTTNQIDIEWQSLLPIADRIPPLTLNAEVPGAPWNHVYGSGAPVPADSEAAVHELWQRFNPDNELQDAGELPKGLFPEGAVRTVVVNRYERDPRARAACIAHWGSTCVACGFDFASVYGKPGEGFIHVHHLIPVSQLGPDYLIDPVSDLRPLCPNCHAMVHTQDPPLTPEELAVMIRTSPKAP